MAKDSESEAVTVVVGQFGTVISRGLRQILAEDRRLHVAAADLDSRALEHAAANLAPQVAILDEHSVVGPDLSRRLRAIRPNIGLLVLAHQPTRGYGLRLLAWGATGCVSTDASAADIVRAVRLAAEGRPGFVWMWPSTHPRARAAGVASLTARERDVLPLLSEGYSNAQIALRLHISVETVRTHVARILRKLGVSGRGELHGITVVARDQKDD